MSKEIRQKISHEDSESESIYLTTFVGDNRTAFCQQIELLAFCNSATITCGYELTPEKLRQLADELECKLR